MFGSFECHDANIATTAGFPGVYPCAAVAFHSPPTEQAKTRGTYRKINRGLVEAIVASECDNGITIRGASDAKDDTINGNGRENVPGSSTAGLPSIAERFEEVTEVRKVCAENVGNAGTCGAGDEGVSDEPFDPSGLPDEDYLDLMFMPLPKEDRSRLSERKPLTSLFCELLPEVPVNETEGLEHQECGETMGNDESVPMIISDDDYLDQMFAPLPPEDKVRLSSNQTKESLFKELLGQDYAAEGLRVYEERRKEDVPSKPPTGDADTVEQCGTQMVQNGAQRAHDVRVWTQAPNSMARSTFPSQPQVEVPADQNALDESAPELNAPMQRSPDDSPKPKKRAKRKRSSKKVAKPSQEGESQQQRKRRRTRVEDMNPADVHVCSYSGCGRRFARRYNLTVHERAHRNEHPFRCDVPGCGKPFMWQSSLVRHLRVHNKGRRSGGRKQRRKSALQPPPHLKKIDEQQYPGACSPSAVNQGKGFRLVEDVRALVSTVCLDQTHVALLGQKKPKIKEEINVKAHLEDRWHQFAQRQQQLEVMWNSPIVISRDIFLRLYAAISPGTTEPHS